MTAGSVGATAAPRIHAVVHLEVEEVVGCDGDDGGRGEGADDAERGDRPRDRLKRFQPTCIPPSNRISTSATTPIRSAVFRLRWW